MGSSLGGLSGPAILQISSYWREGGEIRVDMAPGVDVFQALRAARTATPKRALSTVLIVGFGALISVRSGGLREAHEVSYIRWVVSGAIWVVVPGNTNASVSVSTFNGELDTTFEIPRFDTNARRRSFNFVLGSGKPFFARARPPLRLTAAERIGEEAVRLTYVPV